MPRPSSRMRGVGFGGVAAFFADDAFEFAQAHAVFVGELVVGLGVERSRSCRASHSGALPMMTVSITRNSSKANWSWRRTPIFLGRVTEPLVGSISPVRIFISVDLPAPLGPVIA